MLRSKYSLKPGPKYGRGANCGKVVSHNVETNFEIDSEDKPSNKGKPILRCSQCVEHEITRDDVKTLIESIDKLMAACRTGFKDLVVAVKSQASSQVYLNKKINNMQVNFQKVTDRLRRKDGEAELGLSGLSARNEVVERGKMILDKMEC